MSDMDSNRNVLTPECVMSFFNNCRPNFGVVSTRCQDAKPVAVTIEMTFRKDEELIDFIMMIGKNSLNFK